jgi:hypothetical protein
MAAGKIPSELTQLSSLQELHLHKNNLSGESYIQLHLMIMMIRMQGRFQLSYLS